MGYSRARVVDVVDGRIEVKVHGPRDMPVWGDWFSNEAAASGAGKGTQEEIVRERINALVEYIEKIQDN